MFDDDIKKAAASLGINIDRLELLLKELDDFHSEIENLVDKKIESGEEYQERLEIIEKLDRMRNELVKEKDKIIGLIEKEKKKIEKEIECCFSVKAISKNT